MIRRLFFQLSALVVIIMLLGQSIKNRDSIEQQLPSELTKRLDSLRRIDSLTQWLYAYREYVYEDPVKRVSLLAHAQSSAWRSCKTAGERVEWFNNLIAQGYYLLYSGNILRSIDAYEQAYRFYFAQPTEGEDVLEYVLKPLGNNYTRLGDYDQAFFIQEKSLSLAEQKDSSQIAPICHNLATTAIWKQDLALAKQYCEKGIMNVKKNSPSHGLLLSTLGEVFLKLGKTDTAEKNVREAIRILTAWLTNTVEVNVPYWLLGAWQGLGDIQKERKEPAAALLSYQKAIALIDRYYKGERKREKAQLSVLCGHVLLQLQQPEKGMEQYNSAMSLLLPAFQPSTIYSLPVNNDVYGENTLLDALQGKAACLYALNKKEDALECYMLLFNAERKLRQEFFSNSAKQQQQKENRLWAESAINTAYELWKSTGKTGYAEKTLLIAEMSKAQLLLDEMMTSLRYNRLKNNDSLLNKQQQMIQAIAYYEREAALKATGDKTDSNIIAAKKELQFELSLVEKQVKEKYPAQGNYLSEEDLLSANNLLHNIPDATQAIEFFTGEKNIYIIEAEKGSVQQLYKLDNAPQLLQSVNGFMDTFFQHGPATMINHPQVYYEKAYALYKSLWPNPGMEKEGHTIIIPDGVLGYLPFDALVTDPVYRPGVDQWPFLLKKTSLFFSYSLQTMIEQKRTEHPARSFAGFFVSFDSSKVSIPAVKKEYEEIHSAVNGNFFREEQASLAAFNKQLSEVNILHISTHSFLQGRENMPVLQLADDKFFLFELYGKTFRPQLVVLSACRTGHGMLAQGEGIISLARGFTATGASGIIAGLWDMNDETTAMLMGSFYRQLEIDHQPANALHAAKLQWLQQKKGESFQKLPYFWAGMVYSGDNMPVEVQQRRSSTKLWLIAAIVAAGIVILFRRKKSMVISH